MQTLIDSAHPQWHPLLNEALNAMDQTYLKTITSTAGWLPGTSRLFSAFSIPIEATRYILFGESPYPRAISANGYAFWDNAVESLWSNTGLSKGVNRATSLRNWIKMLLLARGDLTNDFSQIAISRLNKQHYLSTASELFQRCLQQGFLLLNASLVYEEGKVVYHAKQWRPFMQSLLCSLAKSHPHIQLILFGQIAKMLPESGLFSCVIAEHPYNLSFITNPTVLAFFKPLDLLNKFSR